MPKVARHNWAGVTPVTVEMASYSGSDIENLPDKNAESPAHSIDSSMQTSTKPLTVDGRWKVEEQLANMDSKIGKPSVLAPVLKWSATLVLGSGILCLFVYTRLSFLSLVWLMDDKTPAHAPDSTNIHVWSKYTGHFLVIFLLLIITYFILVVRACWMGHFTRQASWPRRSAILWCILTGVLEPLGLMVLALKVIPTHSPAVGVLLTGCAVVMPIIAMAVWSVWTRREKQQTICAVLSVPLVIAAVAMVIILVDREIKSTGNSSLWLYEMTAFLALNTAWMPHVQEWCVRSLELVDADDTTVSCNVSQSETEIPSLPGDSTPNDNPLADTQASSHHLASTKSRDANHVTNGGALVYKSATWKASLIINSVKVLATCLFSFIFFYVDSDHSLESMFSSASHEAFLDAWHFATSIDHQTETWTCFGLNLAGAFVCYILVFIVCHTNMHLGGLLVPLLFSLPLATLVIYLDGWCEAVLDTVVICSDSDGDWYLVIGASFLLSLSQILTFGPLAFPIKPLYYLQREWELFSVPGYQGAILDSWLLLTKRFLNESRFRIHRPSYKTRIYICTTMYREDESEMRQLLESLDRINVAQAQIDHFFESHIVLDGGVVDKCLSDFALQLIALLEETLGIQPDRCTRIKTPYGMQLNWRLPSRKTGTKKKPDMTFSIHLKDNTKVKNKKRWSQIMYMSYVLDHLIRAGQTDEECYILTTDADVMFTAQSVEALLDLMQRDKTVGAVCARTHPIGTGPLVWYQTFEYAVGHWLQKATEHVLGSVLCAPGCFSVYRCRALRDILPKYCKKVENAFDFLTKDMGEDRWLCTLMVQSGWRIEYCAASENSTNCPSEFEEFYKQRRRWIASTLANLMLIIREWKYVALFNQRVSLVFLVYQAVLLFSTLIGPSTVILVVSGGLTFSWDVNPVVSIILQVILCLLFATACVLLSAKTQIKLAKAYTFLYAVLMCAVAVGTAVQIVDDLQPEVTKNETKRNGTVPTTPPTPRQHISVDLPVSVTTIYFGFLAAMFVLTALLHPKELYCLFHFLWYLLCLPSAYLILMIYSICNLTDSSWGTRESSTHQVEVKKESWMTSFRRGFYEFFFCCTPPDHVFQITKGVDTDGRTGSSTERPASNAGNLAQEEAATMSYSSHNVLSVGADRSRSVADASFIDMSYASMEPDSHREEEFQDEEEAIPVEEWLPQEFQGKYTELLKRHGFDNTLFLKGVTEKDLTRMGITMRGHVQYLLRKIADIPAFDIEHKVPVNTQQWLQTIGLPMYAKDFKRNRIYTAREMEILKTFDRKDIEKELGITKEGHVKRLMYAIRMLKEPTEGEMKIMSMRQVIEETVITSLKDCSVVEFEFWKKLNEKCLEPDLKAFGIDAEIKVKLVELRNSWLMIMGVSNILWLILMTTLASKGQLTIIGANVLGLIFIFIYSFIFIIQFICMFVHRLSTTCHYLARAPYASGQPLFTQWSFTKDMKIEDQEDMVDDRQIREAMKKWKRTSNTSKRHTRQHYDGNVTERTPLLQL